MLAFFGCYFTLVLSTYASYPSIRLAELTEQCYVIGNFTEEPMTKRVADTAWAYSCSENKYITAVWSEDVGGRFVKAKCCGNITDNSFSWEIRDLSFFHKGSDRIDEKWNIECEKYAIITGFRFAANERLIFLSSVRCSLLIDKIVDKNNCKLLEFDEKPDQHTNYNDKWQYECPFGYGLVGLYDDQSFMSIKKAKCCKITDEKINPGWKSNFSNNLAGYTQDQDDDNDFELDESYLITIFLKASSKAQFYRIVSPGFSIAPFCFVISQVVSGNAVINIYLRNNSTDLLLRKIKTYVPSKPESYQVLVKPTSRSQLVIEVEISKGLYTIEELSVEEENFCKSKCSIDPMIGCSVNEECLQEGSNSQCVCKKNFTRDEKGNCVIGLHSTNGPSITSGQGKGPDGGDFTLRKSTVQKSSTMITTTSKNVMPEVSKNHIEKNSNLTLVILAAVLSAVILIVILLAFYLCYKNNIPSKLKRMTSFELELHEIEKRGDVGYINNNFLSHQASMDSITSISNSIYRTYMNNIGSVEEVSSSPTIEVTKESQLVSIMVNHTDEEPIYTRINHKSQNMKTSNFLNQQLSPDDAHGYTNLNSDSKNIEKFIRNQYNCSVTYSEPEYGDSLIEDSAAKIEFSIPGSDEEELLSSLHEIDEESIDMSAKVLGQGAFGLVKLALLNSVKGKKEVAVKILKRGNSSNILQDDRVLFWQEAAIMSQFDHPNVIAFYGVMVGKVPSMVVEYLPRGNLWKFLKTAQRLRMANGVHVINHDLHKLFLRMARDIVAGIAYLATLKFVHRDLAARNILLDSDLRCKIADFGLSRHFLKEEHYYLSNGGQIPVKWTAPEALQFKKYSSKSDVWSYGIVLWEIWSIGIRPYENWSNDKVIKEVCENNYRLPAPSGVPSYIYKLMLDCWHTDKNQRPSFSQIKFSLKQDDARIIGKYPVQLERKRSLTFPATEEESHSFDVSF